MPEQHSGHFKGIMKGEGRGKAREEEGRGEERKGGEGKRGRDGGRGPAGLTGRVLYSTSLKQSAREPPYMSSVTSM